jgi:NADPH2:quinone reductase
MKAIQVTRFGGPDVLVPGRMPDPVPGPGEAVISVAAADVLFLDTAIRSGQAAQWIPVRPPYVPGGGAGGRVVSVGEGVPPDWVGRLVVSRTGAMGGSGGYAEQAVAAADHLVPVPDGVDVDAATALLHDGATALGLVASTGVKAGERVLVLGAAGGLGALLVQLALAAGARVIGTARGEAKLALIWDLGADAVDYSNPGWAKRVAALTGDAGPDVVFDGVGGDLGREAFRITSDGGRFSAHGAPSGDFAAIDPREAERRQVTVKGIEQVQFQPGEHARLLRAVLAEHAAGRIRPIIGHRFPLDQAAAAHAAIEARSAVGKTLLTVRD